MTEVYFKSTLRYLCKHRSYLRKHIRLNTNEYLISYYLVELKKCNLYIVRLYTLKTTCILNGLYKAQKHS